MKTKGHSMARTRYIAYIKARRKQRLDHEISYHPYYNNLHQYSKNKIHCSCPDCSPKTKANRHKVYTDYYGFHKKGPYNWKRSDMIKQIIMDEKIEEYLRGEDTLF